MPTLKVLSTNETDHTTSANMFEVNTVAGASTGSRSALDTGMMNQLSVDALKTLGTSIVRFPGGMPDEYFSDGMLTNDGKLPHGLVEFLTQAQEIGIRVILVIPVEPPHGQSRESFKFELTEFSRLIEDRFNGLVTGYELGNEYYAYRAADDSSVEYEYGINAAHAALAINDGLKSPQSVDIFVQGANNVAGAHNNSVEDGNEVLRAALDSVGDLKSVIDGVTRNVYFQERDNDGFSNDYESGGSTRLDVTFSGWDQWAQRDIIERIGEYNVKTDVARDMWGQQGLDVGDQGAGMLLEHFTHLIDSSVDQAAIWPLGMDFSATSLFNNADPEISTTVVAGLELMTNTTRSAMFDLLSQTVTGHSYIEADWSFAGKLSAGAEMDVEVTLFEDSGVDAEEEHVIFLSSRSSSSLSFETDLSEIVGNRTASFIRGISIDNENVINPAAGVGGRKSINQADAVIKDVTDDIGDGINFTLELQPYEVVQITLRTEKNLSDGFVSEPRGVRSFDIENYSNSPASLHEVLGTADNDVIRGGNGREKIMGDGGDDNLKGFGGGDHIYAGRGHDYVHGGNGNDRLFGGWGSDELRGGNGHDKIYGGGANDVIFGNKGRDVISGGRGNDSLHGGAQADRFTFEDGDGFDRILDFHLGIDKIDLSNHSARFMEDLSWVVFDQGSSTLIRFRDELGLQDNDLGGIVLEGIKFGTVLSDSDFIF